MHAWAAHDDSMNVEKRKRAEHGGKADTDTDGVRLGKVNFKHVTLRVSILL